VALRRFCPFFCPPQRLDHPKEIGGNMTFWMLAGAMALILTVSLVAALLKGRRETGPAEAFDLQVYRDQLREVEQDAKAGKIPSEEADRLRTEISRRILAADSKSQQDTQAGTQPKTLGLVMAGGIALVLLGGGFAIYAQLGVPGYPDMPLQARLDAAEAALRDRPSQADAERNVPPSLIETPPEDYLALVVKLREAVAQRPDDLRGLTLLARTETALGNHVDAYQAYARIVTVKGDEVAAGDLTNLADSMIIAAGGYVSPEAQKVLDQTLDMDPENGVARFYAGLMMAQTGRPDLGFRIWDNLLRGTPENAAWRAPILEQIDEMAFRAGVSDYSPPEGLALPGPSADDIANASELDAQDRQNMIRGMVDQLGERLATQGGSAQEWGRLISSLTVLGETERAGAIWSEAQGVFAAQPQALEVINAAAAEAGLIE
jgi:cytochrome c-type biogenesis protein CcmH